MPAEYFEARERALLGERYERLYAAPQETAARGVTVSALRTTPEEFAARADFPLRPSPFCKAAFVVECPDFKPGRHPYHHAGVFYSQEPSASSAAPLLGVRPGMRVLDLCAAPGGKSSQLAAALPDQRQTGRNGSTGAGDRVGSGGDRGGRQRRPGRGSGNVGRIEWIDEARGAGQLHLRGVRALRGAANGRGRRVDEQGARGQRGGGNHGDSERGQSRVARRCHLFLHTDRALAAAITRQMPAPMRQGIIHQAL